MKIGTIVQPNEKGQVVIPKTIRDALGITSRVPLNLIVSGSGIWMYPIKAVLGAEECDSEPLIAILKKTQGSWAKEDWDTLRKKRRKIELAASRRRKNAW